MRGALPHLLPLRTSVAGALTTFVIALLVTAGGYHLANGMLEAWIDHRLESGTLPPWEDPHVERELAARTSQRSWSEVRVDRLHWIAPTVFASAVDLDPRANSQKYWLAADLPFAGREDPPRERRSEPLRRSHLLEFFERLEANAKTSGGSWPRNSVAGPVAESQVYLRRLLLSGTESKAWRDSLDRRLRGVEPPPTGREDDPTGALRRAVGLRDPVQPRPFEGDLWQVDRAVDDEREHESNSVALEVLEGVVNGIVLRLQEAAAAPRRVSIALNGPIQWLTILVGVWCAALLLNHWWQTRTATKRLESANTAEAKALLGRFEQQLDERLDTLHDWLLVMVPMLGFIGTIVGMTLAMGNAGEVATASTNAEVRRAVDRLAGYLGTAFDTTLVGLLLSIWLDGLRRWVRMSDSRLHVLLRDR